MTTTNTKAKFTATLVTPEDKARIVELRKLTSLSEKELMTLVINIAVDNTDIIVASAAKINEEQSVKKAARQVEKRELAKALKSEKGN